TRASPPLEGSTRRRGHVCSFSHLHLGDQTVVLSRHLAPNCTLVGQDFDLTRFVIAGCANPLQAITGPRGTFPVALSSEPNPLIRRAGNWPMAFGGGKARGGAPLSRPFGRALRSPSTVLGDFEPRAPAVKLLQLFYPGFGVE